MLYTWHFNGTCGSLLLHAATNTTGLFVATTLGSPFVGVALTWLAAVIVLRFGYQHLTR